jgi:hypothetical protein
MTRLLIGAGRLTCPALLLVQIACGGDASGPRHTPTSIEANSSLIITGPAGTAALERPSVIVRDENGNPLAGATVVFSVTSGDGAVSGASVTTGSDGVATVGTWTLGPTASTNTVDATVAGLPAVTFTANAGDPCKVTPAYSVGGSSDGRLGLADCQVSDASFVDFWLTTIPATATYLFNESSTQFDSYLLLLTTDYHVIAQNDNASSTTHNSTIKTILPAGNFLVGANSLNPRETGSYSLSSGPTNSPVTNCEDVFAVPGISTDQSLQTTDCNASGFYSDDYIVFINTGQTITVTMTSSTIDPYLELYEIRSGGTLVAANDDASPTTKNASLTYTASNLGYFFIKARTTASNATGAYTLTIQ